MSQQHTLKSTLSLPFLMSLGLTLTLMGPAAAQRLNVSPSPGLWETTHRITLNGVDVMALVRESMAQAVQAMPSEQRAAAAQALREQSEAFSGKRRDCLTAEQARDLADPRALVAQLNAQQDASGEGACRFELVSASGNTMQLRGQCQPQQGWAGTLQGTLTLHDAQQWSARFNGTGRLLGELPPGIPKAGGAVQAVMESRARWQAASCGGVAPTR